MDDAYRDAYYQTLLAGERASQDLYDKTVLTLSGGALGVSFVFLKDVVAGRALLRPGWLLAAWTLWATSAALVLVSMYLSVLAHRRAQDQVGASGVERDHFGGWATRVLLFVNPVSGALFLAGVAAMILFVRLNLR